MSISSTVRSFTGRGVGGSEVTLLTHPANFLAVVTARVNLILAWPDLKLNFRKHMKLHARTLVLRDSDFS